MKNYKHLFLATAVVLGVAVFLIPYGTNAAGLPSGLFTFISPLAGEKIVVGKTYYIKWTGPIEWIVSPGVTESIRNVKLTVSCGDPSLGATNDTVIVKSTKNDGLYKWSVPKKIGLSDYCRIIIEDTKGKYYDVSSVFGIGMTPAPTLNVSCFASPSSANINQAVTFISSVSGGTGSYSYSWSGACTGTDANCSNSFSSSGTYSASLSVISGSQSKSASCSVSVTVPTPIGSLAVTKMTTSPSGDVILSAPNAVLAKFELKATGERIKVGSLRVSATVATDTSVGQLRNGAVYANGVQIGSTTDIETVGDIIDTTNEYTTYNFGSSLIVEPGSPVTLEVKADIYDNDGTNHISANDTILIKIVGGDLNNAYGMASMATIDVPSEDVSGNTLTVRQGGLTLSKYVAYTDQTVVAPLTNFKLAHFTLTADSAEAVNVNTIQVDLTNLATYATNLYVKFGNSTTAVKATVGATNTWSVNYPLAAGQTVDVNVYGDVNSLASGTGVTSLLISGVGASSATTINTNSGSPLAGQTINFVTGSISSAVDSSTPLAQAVSGNQQVTAAKFKFTASNDSYTIHELRVTVNGDILTAAVINSAILKDGSTVLAIVPYDSSNNWLYFTGLNVAIPSNTTKVLTVDLSLATPYTDGTTITTGKNVKVALTYFKVLNSQGIASTQTVNNAGNDIYVYKSIPTLTVGTVTGQGVNLSAGSTTSLYKFSVAADVKGPVALKQLKLNVVINKNSSSGTPILSNFKFFRGSTDITSQVTIQNNSGNSLEGATSIGTGTNIIVVTFDTEEVAPAGTTYTYTLKAIPSGFSASVGGNDSVATSMLADNLASADSALYFLSAVSNTGVQTLYTAANHGGGDTLENVIWSDNSALMHDYNYSASSPDWFNGYLINNLPLDSIGIVAQ